MARTTHERQTIRHAAKAALEAAAVVEDGHLFTSRKVAWRKRDLPAVALYAVDENVDPDSAASAPRELVRRLQLVVEGAIEATTPAPNNALDDALDALALKIEKALDADTTLSGACGDMVLASTSLDMLEDGEKSIGVVTLTFAVTYRSWAPEQEDGELSDFKAASIRTSLNGDQAEDDQAEDDVVLQP